MADDAVAETGAVKKQNPVFLIDTPDPVWKPTTLYSPLDSSKKQVRFLLLRPSRDGTGQDPISCVLITTPLVPNIYQAISYRWGSISNPKSILVNGHPLAITQNLHELLSQFRRITKFWQTLLWIDAICINQEDLDERSSQVQIMGEIYSGAEGVHIWLGPETEQTGRVVELMKKVPRYRDARGEDLVGIVDDEEVWGEFRRMVEHEWFSRLWVIQEALLARIPLVWCGPHPFLLETILNTGYALVEAIYHDFEGLKRPIDTNWAWLLAGKFAKLDHAAYPTKHIKLVLEGLANGQRGTCSDPRDHVYGLLSLLPQALGVIVDYNLSVAEVFTGATIALMEWSKTLEPLRLKTPSRDDLELPSWVLDFRAVASYVSTSNDPIDDYDACAGLPHSGVHSAPNELHVRGMIVSTIVAQHSYKLLDDDDIPGPGEEGYNEDEYFRKVLSSWRSFASQHTKADDVDFWSTIATDRIPSNLPHGTDTSRMPFKHTDADTAQALTEWISDPKIKLNTRLCAVLKMRVVENMLFATADGRLGSVLGDCEVGDTIEILAGLSRPAILRRGGDGTGWRFVASCYVDGLMDGEFVRNVIESQSGRRDAVDEVFSDMILV